MSVPPPELIGRAVEWRALDQFLSGGGRFGVVYGPRRAGKSFLLNALTISVGGWHYQAVGGTSGFQLEDIGRDLGRRLRIGDLRFRDWSEVFERLADLGDSVPLVILDEFPYLSDAAPELPGVLQRHLDRRVGPPIIVCGSAMSTMVSLIEQKAPLYGRSSLNLVPSTLAGHDLATLWGAKTAESALWIDAVLGGLPGYRPLLPTPKRLDDWMIDSVLASSSPILDAGDAALAMLPEPALKGLFRSILFAVASGETTFSGIARACSVATTAVTRPIKALERAGILHRIPDPLRDRRDSYEIADPHLRFSLRVVAPYRSALGRGAAREVWSEVRDTTWPSQILGPRWESVVRAFVATHSSAMTGVVAGVVGRSVVADPSAKIGREVDLVVVSDGRVRALGEVKLRKLGWSDLERLRTIRTLINEPEAKLILASGISVDPKAVDQPDVVSVLPADIYSSPSGLS